MQGRRFQARSLVQQQCDRIQRAQADSIFVVSATSLSEAEDGANGCEFEVHGTGGDVYDVTLSPKNGWVCGCPDGARLAAAGGVIACKHICALLLKAVKLREPLLVEAALEEKIPLTRWKLRENLETLHKFCLERKTPRQGTSPCNEAPGASLVPWTETDTDCPLCLEVFELSFADEGEPSCHPRDHSDHGNHGDHGDVDYHPQGKMRRMLNLTDDLWYCGDGCRHIMHRSCLAIWYAKNKTCPLCRDIIPPDNVPLRPPLKRPLTSASGSEGSGKRQRT